MPSRERQFSEIESGVCVVEMEMTTGVSIPINFIDDLATHFSFPL